MAAPLVLLMGCDALNPALQYQAAARQLAFSLDRVEPRLELAFPLDRSRLHLQLDLGVNNPSDVRLTTRRVTGDLHLLAQDADHRLGSVAFPEGVDLAPKGRSTLKAELTFSYGDLKEAWGPLSAAVLRHQPATWTLAGEAQFQILGISFSVPFQTRTASGS
jgi:LEA14-like dessication related protein